MWGGVGKKSNGESRNQRAATEIAAAQASVGRLWQPHAEGDGGRGLLRDGGLVSTRDDAGDSANTVASVV